MDIRRSDLVVIVLVATFVGFILGCFTYSVATYQIKNGKLPNWARYLPMVEDSQ